MTDTLMIGALAAAVAALALIIPRLADMILAAVNAIGMVVALSYRQFSRSRPRKRAAAASAVSGDGIRAVVLPVLSAATLLGLGGYLGWSFYTSADHLELSPNNGWFLLLVPSLIVASGFLAAAWAKWGRRSPYFHTGRGTDADAPQLLAVQQPSA